jgi:hypothetical protein
MRTMLEKRTRYLQDLVHQNELALLEALWLEGKSNHLIP